MPRILSCYDLREQSKKVRKAFSASHINQRNSVHVLGQHSAEETSTCFPKLATRHEGLSYLIAARGESFSSSIFASNHSSATTTTSSGTSLVAWHTGAQLEVPGAEARQDDAPVDADESWGHFVDFHEAVTPKK